MSLVLILRFSHLQSISHVFFEVRYQVSVHCLLGLLRVGYEFTNEIFTFLYHFEVETVEINVDELVHTNQRFFFDFVVVFVKTDQLAVLIQSQKQHLKAVVDSQAKPVSYQTHQNFKEYQVDTLLCNRSLESHQFLQEHEELLSLTLISTCQAQHLP